MSNPLYNLIFALSIIYFIIVSVMLFRHGNGISPDQFFALALLITLIMGKLKEFIRDWSPPVILLLSYDYLRGLVPNLSLKAHVYPMINFDKAVFGFIPTNRLQQMLFSDNSIHWYDYIVVIFYLSHFIVPLFVAFIFWNKNKEYFKEYSASLLVLSYAAFITYIIFPAVPPWMAAQQGYIPGVVDVMDKVFASLAHPINLPTVYRFIGVNLVAAVPSLHASYPWLTFLFIWKKFRRAGLLLLPYVLGVWFSIVYLGEHYVFDIFTGVLYATLAFFIVTKRRMLLNRIRKLKFASVIIERRWT